MPSNNNQASSNKAEIRYVRPDCAFPKSRFLKDKGRYVIKPSSLWKPGSRVTVAFHGGTPLQESEVAHIASEWTANGNLYLDFGFNPQTGTYRQWNPTDTVYAADIRVQFHDGGFNQSNVGTDSRNPQIAPPNEPSVWLDYVDLQDMTTRYRKILHEFGHALGFQHEHQSPSAACDFRWEDDEGYIFSTDDKGRITSDSFGRKPGVYTLSGWDRKDTDYNYQPLPFQGHSLSAMDLNSIMMYSLPSMFFYSGKSSHCYHSLNSRLSDLDKAGFAKWYP